jgi:hypothetical protein
MDVIIVIPGLYISEITNVGKVKSKYFHKGEKVNFPDWYAKQLVFLNLVSMSKPEELPEEIVFTEEKQEKLSNFFNVKEPEQAFEATELLTEKRKSKKNKK